MESSIGQQAPDQHSSHLNLWQAITDEVSGLSYARLATNFKTVDFHDCSDGHDVKITAHEAVTGTGATPWIPEPDDVEPLRFEDRGPASRWVEQYSAVRVADEIELVTSLNRMAKLGWEYQQVILHPANGDFTIIFSRDAYIN